MDEAKGGGERGEGGGKKGGEMVEGGVQVRRGKGGLKLDEAKIRAKGEV